MISGLNQRVALYSADASADGQGGQSRTWSFAYAAWAGIKPLGFSTATSGRSVRRLRFILRYRSDLPRPARLIWNDTQYSVLADSDPDLRGERLHLICEEL